LRISFFSDDSYLLQFLRVSKFSNAEAFKRLEKFLVLLQTNPKWFEKLSLDDLKLAELFETGYIISLKERDENGCRVIIIRTGIPDVKKFSYCDFLRIGILIILTELAEPETQVAGTVIIFDDKNIKVEFLASFPFQELLTFYKVMQNAFPLRIRNAFGINMAKFVVTFVGLIRPVMSKKLNERTILSSSEDSIKPSHRKLFPKEHGGTIPIKDMLEDMKIRIKAQEENIRLILQQRINLSLVKNVKVEQVESFKKLEID
jgi:CRAL/TRIO domain